MVFNQAAQNGFVRFAFAAAYGRMPGFDGARLGLFVVCRHGFKLDHGQVALLAEGMQRVPHIGHAARHAGGKVAAGFAQHHHGAARHVFAAMIPSAFHHRRRARVAHGKAFAHDAADVGLAGQRAVQHRVAGNDVVGAVAAKIVGRAHHNAAARQAFADVVIGFAHQVQRNAVRQKRAKALSGRAVALNVNGVVRQPLVAILAGHHAREHGADGAIAVAYRRNEGHFFTALDGGFAALDQLVVQRAHQAVVLVFDLAPWRFGHDLVEDAGKVQSFGFPMIQAAAGVEQINAADQLVKAPNAQLRHDFAHFFGDEEEVVDDVLGLALEFLAQLGVLRGHAHRAGVQMAFAHHDAAFYHQRCGGKAEFVGAQERANGHVATGFHLAVGLHANAAAQVVQHQCLLGFGQAQFPGRARVLDGRDGRGARAAIVAGNHHMVGLGFGHTGRDRAHTHFRHQLDRDGGARIDVFQVVNQLRQVFDGVNVVVRRG